MPQYLNEIRDEIVRKINADCIERGHFLGKAPGSRYSWQLYLSRLLYSPVHIDMIADWFWLRFHRKFEESPFQLAGREWSAIPLLTALPQHFVDLKLNSFMIRRERKNYGIHNYVEGKPNDLPVLIVDDLCNSTNSFLHCKNVIQNELKLEVYPDIFAVLNKKSFLEDGYGYDKYLGPDYKAITITDLHDIDI